MKIRYLISDPPNSQFGLGDAVHSVAHPAAEIIDRFLKTEIAHCKSCHERREKWNAAIPDIKKLMP